MESETRGSGPRRLAARIKERARDAGIRMRSVTSTYGYFAMLPFVAPWARQAKVEWLLDQYVGARALYPNAELFSYVGHSNGTYLLTGALQRCPAVRFARIVFAGSVVRRDFDWPAFIGRKQVARVLNYVATADWVVALFPKGLQTLRLQDLGGAGHDGFDCDLDELRDVEYVSGQHSAALDERHWADIARFVVDGTWPTAEAGPEKRSTLVRVAGGVAPALWVLLAVVALAPGVSALDGARVLDARLVALVVALPGGPDRPRLGAGLDRGPGARRVPGPPARGADPSLRTQRVTPSPYRSNGARSNASSK